MIHIPRNFPGIAAALISRVLAMQAHAAQGRRDPRATSIDCRDAHKGGEITGDARIRASCTYRGPSDHDRPLEPGQAPPLGAHIVTPRRGYTHHGIPVGQGRVVQYRGLARGLRTGPVEEVSLAQFAHGYPLRVRAEASPCFDGAEVVRRARSRIGEDRYHLLTNNCEHFCEWCLRAEPRSYQVDEWFSRPRLALRTMISSVSTSYSRRASLRGPGNVMPSEAIQPLT